MNRLAPNRPRIVLVFAALLVAMTFGMAAELIVGPTEILDVTAVASEAGLLDAQAGGTPPCLGFTTDDPCITPKALGECRSAVARCGEDLVGVVLTCPLQFVCGG